MRSSGPFLVRVRKVCRRYGSRGAGTAEVDLAVGAGKVASAGLALDSRPAAKRSTTNNALRRKLSIATRLIFLPLASWERSAKQSP